MSLELGGRLGRSATQAQLHRFARWLRRRGRIPAAFAVEGVADALRSNDRLSALQFGIAGIVEELNLENNYERFVQGVQNYWGPVAAGSAGAGLTHVVLNGNGGTASLQSQSAPPTLQKRKLDLTPVHPVRSQDLNALDLLEQESRASLQTAGQSERPKKKVRFNLRNIPPGKEDFKKILKKNIHSRNIIRKFVKSVIPKLRRRRQIRFARRDYLKAYHQQYSRLVRKFRRRRRRRY